METQVLFGVMAAAAAFACMFAAVYAGSASITRRRAAMAAQGEEKGVAALVKWRLRNGFSIVLPAARQALRWRKVAYVADEAVLACASWGAATTRESVLTVIFAGIAFVSAVVGIATGSIAGTAAVAVCLCVVMHVMAGSAHDKRRESVREAVPGALESMAACFGSGFTLLQTFNQVAQDAPGYLGETFRRSAHVLETGGSAQEALSELRDNNHATDLAFVAMALDVQHEVGGSMRQVLDAANDSVKGELALRRSLRVQTAQAKLSARIVVVMPFILVALFSIVSPDFLTPFFSSTLGYGLLALAVTMQVVGVFLVNRALAVDGVS